MMFPYKTMLRIVTLKSCDTESMIYSCRLKFDCAETIPFFCSFLRAGMTKQNDFKVQKCNTLHGSCPRNFHVKSLLTLQFMIIIFFFSIQIIRSSLSLQALHLHYSNKISMSSCTCFIFHFFANKYFFEIFCVFLYLVRFFGFYIQIH